MASSTASNTLAGIMRSYHSKERYLYARMVLILAMDPVRSMEVIAFWLWLEERGHMDVVHRINALDDYVLHAIATLGQTFVEVLRFDLPTDHPTHRFRQEAVQGIIYYLNHVCYKVLEDIRRKAEYEANLRDQMEMLVREMGQTSLNGDYSQNSLVSRSPPDVEAYVPHGEGSSRGVGRTRVSGIPTITEVENQILSGYPFNQPTFGVTRPLQQYHGGGCNNSIMACRNHQVQSHHVPYVRDNIPREERTLFVTFSNGYPLTEHELHSFFMRSYGDVEVVTIQKTKGNKPPLFAHVSFYSLATVNQVLDGNAKVKFITKGKHLWARRYYPRRNEENKNE